MAGRLSMNQKLFALCMFNAAESIFFEEEEDDDEDTTENSAKVDQYAERTIPNMGNILFKMHFRMSRMSFDNLIRDLSPILDSILEDGGVNSLIDHEKQLLMSLWVLATPDSYRSVADRFGISKSTCHSAVMIITKAILRLNVTQKLITWPSKEEQNTITQGFLNCYGFPGTIGAIDGSHIPIKAPSASKASYVNRKGVHSILLQGVCDNKLRFRDCYAGEVGSIHDACMFRRSPLYTRMETESTTLMNGNHILGDLAYPLRLDIMVPYKNTGRVTKKQEKYNKCMSAARSCIERAFALLKGRWRRLKYLDMSAIDRIPYIIIACCVLHNVCIGQADDIVDMQATEDDDDDTLPEITSGSLRTAEHTLGAIKRDKICEDLSARR